MALLAPLRRGKESTKQSLLTRAPALKATVDSLRANVFIADLDLRLIYGNRMALETMAHIEPHLKEQFGVSLADIMDGSIHRFHKDPRRIEALLANPATFPHQATFTFGAVQLTTHINSITADDATVLGYVVVWADTTSDESVRAVTADTSATLLSLGDTLETLTTQLTLQASDTAEGAQTPRPQWSR